MKTRRLSHSSVSLFSQCGEKFRLHYDEGLREKVGSSALLFGSAVDNTLNELLKDKQREDVKSVSYYQNKFENNWLIGEINKQKIEMPETLDATYADSDMQFDVLNTTDISRLKNFLIKNTIETETGKNDRESVEKTYDKIAAIKRATGIENMYQPSARFVNLANWLSLNHKGKAMIETYYNKILPRITKVLYVQEVVNLDNEEGDSVIGYVDLVAEIDGVVRILDNKTSAREYDKDSANISAQLAIYRNALRDRVDTPHVGFIVMRKGLKLNKSKCCSKCGNDGTGNRARTCDKEIRGERCKGEWIETVSPEAIIEDCFGTINEYFETQVIDNYENVLHAIRSEQFYKNWTECVKPYGRCPYYNICHTGKEEKLIKV